MRTSGACTIVVLHTCLNKGVEETRRRLCLLHVLLAIMRFLASTPLLLLLHVHSIYKHTHTKRDIGVEMFGYRYGMHKDIGCVQCGQ